MCENCEDIYIEEHEYQICDTCNDYACEFHGQICNNCEEDGEYKNLFCKDCVNYC